ncbi:MAG: SRPBCC family protein [Ginsengibacter sp.]
MAVNISMIVIQASAEKVWNALTEAALVKQWQYGSDLVTDWKVGSDIRFTTKWEDKIFEQWGKVLEVRPNSLLRYSLFAPRPGLEDKPENYFTMSYILTRSGESTKVEILQEDTRPNAVQEKQQGEENPVLQSLKKIAEGNELEI